jgi:hypothetical protein
MSRVTKTQHQTRRSAWVAPKVVRLEAGRAESRAGTHADLLDVS